MSISTKEKVVLVFIASVLTLLPVQVQAASISQAVGKGNHLYEKGQFDDSLNAYQDAIKRKPESDILNFNLGTALYKKNRYNDAISHFQKAILSDKAELRERAYYNLGNSFYKSGIEQGKGNIQGAIKLLEESLEHFQSALSLDKKDSDAQYNYDFVKKELERLRQEQQKQQEGQNQEQSNSEEQKQQEEQKPKEQNESQEKSGENELKEEAQEKQEEAGESQKAVSGEEFTQEEAQKLLQHYQQTEEPQGLLKVFKGQVDTGGVVKDW